MTLKRGALTLLLLGSFLRVFAQLDTNFFHQPDPNMPKGYIGFYGGYAIPSTNFEATGSAGAGFNFGISMAYPARDSAKRRIYGMAFKTDYHTLGYGGGGVGISGPYRAYSVMAGLFLTFPLEIVSIDLRALGGVMYSRSGSYTDGFVDSTGNVVYYHSQTSVGATSFVYDVGLGLRYSQRFGGWHEWMLMIYVDRIQSNPQYRVIETNPSGQNPVLFAPDFQLWSVTIGAGIQL
jgi:hypothetical protein